MNYGMKTPCDECPFLNDSGFDQDRLEELCSGEFPCHKACDLNDEGQFVAKPSGKTPHCAGALIYLEKDDAPHQMMRIAERLGMYDRTKLDMDADVQERY